MSAANPNPMEKSMVSVLVVANAGGGSPLPWTGNHLAHHHHYNNHGYESNDGIPGNIGSQGIQ
jgi:fatty-acid desaturase